MNFAIIGASGNVGRKTIEVLEKSNISLNSLFLVASKKSTGKKRVHKKSLSKWFVEIIELGVKRDNLPQEARNIYYDKRKNKNIYGKATLEETEELREEGIELTTIPWIDNKKDN